MLNKISDSDSDSIIVYLFLARCSENPLKYNKIIKRDACS